MENAEKSTIKWFNCYGRTLTVLIVFAICMVFVLFGVSFRHHDESINDKIMTSEYAYYRKYVENRKSTFGDGTPSMIYENRYIICPISKVSSSKSKFFLFAGNMYFYQKSNNYSPIIYNFTFKNDHKTIPLNYSNIKKHYKSIRNIHPLWSKLADLRRDKARFGEDRKYHKRLLKNNSWYKTVIIRDPLERLLSGYLDKCADPNHHWCENIHHHRGRKFVTFAQFVDNIAYKLKYNIEINNHYRPQSFRCGLYKFIQYYNSIIYYDYNTVGNQFLNSLKKSSLIIGDKNSQQLMKYFTGWGKYNDQSLLDAPTVHTKKSYDLLKQYYTPQIARKAYNTFKMDYVLLNFSYPKWIDDEW